MSFARERHVRIQHCNQPSSFTARRGCHVAIERKSGQPGCGQPVVAVRVWPASSYTRVTVESNRQLKYKQFALSNPERVVVDIEDVNLNSVLKGMAAQIRADDPFIKSARVGQFDPQTVRMVLN
ncbi:hypothetical protein DMI60_19505 [Escherichia coli]|nr:hypothetical protein [Escherichia coli]